MHVFVCGLHTTCSIPLVLARLENTQFSLEELRAIVEEAEAAGTYVCAHAYMPSAIKRAVQCGVRSIEHGNWLDEECAQLMVTRGVFLVPTVVTYDALRKEGVAAGMSAYLVAKVGRAVEEVWLGSCWGESRLCIDAQVECAWSPHSSQRVGRWLSFMLCMCGTKGACFGGLETPPKVGNWLQPHAWLPSAS
jgi:hypothetical protein